MKTFLTIILMLVSSIAWAQQKVKLEGSDSALVWNKWQTENFVILSIDEKQGLWLSNNIEPMKTWVYTRWGLPDIKFPKRVYSEKIGPEAGCMLMCVPTKELMQKIWKKEKSCVETRKDSSGKTTMNFILLLLDKSPAESVPYALTIACTRELEAKMEFKCNLALTRGMAALNGTLPQIRARINYLDRQVVDDTRMFVSKSMFSMEETDLPTTHEYLFDSQAAIVCLLLRKELGEEKFLELLMTFPFSESTLKKIYKFENFGAFDSTFKRFMRNLIEDVKSKKTPDNYLQIIPAKK
jgi:hypothetical protein